MDAINPTKFNFPISENHPLGATEALRTGLFHPIDNLDPDIARQPKISTGEPSLWSKIIGLASGR